MTLYESAKAACDAGRTLAEVMPALGATVADDTWPVVRAVKAARFEFELTRNWPVTVWVRNGPGDDDVLEAIADVGGVAFDLQELPTTKDMTDAEIERYTRAEVRKQIREGIRQKGKALTYFTHRTPSELQINPQIRSSHLTHRDDGVSSD